VHHPLTCCAGVTGAVSKLTLGLRNTLDSKEKLKADAKYKSNDLAFEFQESNNNMYDNVDNNSGEEYASTSQLASYEVMEDYDASNSSSSVSSPAMNFARK
jgi:hypothetical protein